MDELPADLAARADAFALLDQLRQKGPVQRVRLNPGPAVWLVTGHAEVLSAFGDRRLSSEAHHAAEVLLAESPNAGNADDGDQLGGSMLTADPPEHTRLRALVSRSFTARRIESLRPRIELLADALVDEFAPRGEVDLIPAYALPLPLQVICELLGVPLADRDQIREWSDALFAAPVDDAAVASVLAARGALRDYLLALVRAKRRTPGDDLLSAMAAPGSGGDAADASDEELAATGVLLLIAGHETTAGLIASGTLRLLERPERLSAVRAAPDLLPAAVEEFLRVDGAVVAGVVRYTREPVDIAGTRIPAGQPVLLSTPAANRDPARFDAPGMVDFARADNPHLSFGHGIHYCLGAPLARLEAEVAIGTLLRRLPGIALADPGAGPEWRPGAVRRLASLRVTFPVIEASPK